jgi:hypothetical protein
MTTKGTTVTTTDSNLENVRVERALWKEAGVAAKAHGTDRSKVMRAALEREVAMDTDPVLAATLRLAAERGTTVDAVERLALTQYLRRLKRLPKS